MFDPTWLLIALGVLVLGVFGFKLAKRWRETGHEPNPKPPYFT